MHLTYETHVLILIHAIVMCGIGQLFSFSTIW